MEVLNFGGFDYYVVYRIYVTEPCLLRPEVEIKSGCTRHKAKCAEPVESGGIYKTAEDAANALKKYKSTVQSKVRSSLGAYYNIVREYYVQTVIVDDKWRPVHIEEDERVYAEIVDK